MQAGAQPPPTVFSEYYVGIMSGTSLDGIDVVLVDFASHVPRLLAHTRSSLPVSIQEAVRHFFVEEAAQLSRFAVLDVQWGQLFAQAALHLVDKSGVPMSCIRAVGCHGQTLLHQPQHAPAFTLQLGDPNILVAELGCPVVVDWRRRDLACGGQGAPLAPCFHAAFFHDPASPRIIVNIGGIANITGLGGAQPVPQFGFDTGPGNVLLDAWVQRHHGRDYDINGQWAASCEPDMALLALLETDPYWQCPAPKSTGRAYFNLDWLQQYLGVHANTLAAGQVQCTLTHLTAKTIAQSIIRYGKGGESVWVCGGGAHNIHLMQLLNTYLPAGQVAKTVADLGFSPDTVEAMGFAWLAKRRMEGRATDLGGVTGGTGAYTIGGVYLP